MCLNTGDPQARIGLEVHVQLELRTKAFCSCALNCALNCALTDDEAGPDSGCCPVCLGLPGSLPALNGQIPALAVRLAMALESRVAARWSFDRKSYFYPDMPRGYQITQWRNPCATGGRLPLPVDEHGEVLCHGDGRSRAAWRPLPLQRLHVEEDAGSSRHSGGGSEVDYRRAGAPLVEIVSEPQLRTPAEAVAALRQLRQLVRWLGVGNAQAETGGLRCDGNLSLSDTDGTLLAGPVEVKNLNSLRFLERALHYEDARLRKALKDGVRVGRESRGYDEQADRTFAMRDKESGADYRYSPEPDLPDLVLEESWLDQQRDTLLLLPWQAREQLEELGLLPAEIEGLLEDAAAARWLLSWSQELEMEDARAFAHRLLGRDTRTALPLLADAGELVRLQHERRITRQGADRLFWLLCERSVDVATLAREEGLLLEHDEKAAVEAVHRVLTDCPDELARLRAGEKRLLEYLLGQVLRQLKRNADPRLVRALLQEHVSQEIDADRS